MGGFAPETLYLFLVPAFVYETIAVGFYGKVASRTNAVKGSFIAALVSGTLLLVMSYGSVFTFAAGILLIRPAQQYLRLFMLSYLQKRLNPTVRVSTLSVISLLQWALIAPAAYVSGVAADHDWILQLSFYFGLAIIFSAIVQAMLNLFFSRSSAESTIARD